VRSLLLGGALLLLAADPAPAPADPATWAERLAFNARERTARGLEALGRDEPEAALPRFETALRLAPAEPLARFNGGTARLAAGDAAGAAPLLEAFAAEAPAELAPAAWYNLGNAKLAAGDAAGAVASYRETLRRRAGHADAKHNLELALRALERQQQKQKQEQQQRQQQQEQQRQGQQGQQGEPQREQPPKPGPGQGKSPLPQFQEQEDMTAKQAADLLQSVENLERQQRRQRALEQSQARHGVEKDW
jgi:Ca-activated chloride channel family protein